MMARHRAMGLVAAFSLVLAIAAPTLANTGPNRPTTEIVQASIPISFVGTDSRSYTGQAYVQRDQLTGTEVAGFYWSWRNIVTCDNGTPDPTDDFEAEELIDFTVDSIVPTSFAIASNLGSSSGVLTKSGHRIHVSACDGVTLENVIETHTVSFAVAASGPATRSKSRERIVNGDGTIMTIVVKEIHRPAAGSMSIDVGGTIDPVVGADLAHIEIVETTR